MGCHSLLQEIFPTQGSDLGSRIADRFFTTWVEFGIYLDLKFSVVGAGQATACKLSRSDVKPGYRKGNQKPHTTGFRTRGITGALSTGPGPPVWTGPCAALSQRVPGLSPRGELSLPGKGTLHSGGWGISLRVPQVLSPGRKRASPHCPLAVVATSLHTLSAQGHAAGTSPSVPVPHMPAHKSVQKMAAQFKSGRNAVITLAWGQGASVIVEFPLALRV